VNELFIDIETRRTADQALIKRLMESVSPPGNYKKAETIAEWWKNEGATARLEAVNRTALDGTYGRLASVAWAMNDEAVKCVRGDDELALLNAAAIEFRVNTPMDIVAFNGEFDLRFLYQRMVINKIPVPHPLRHALRVREGWIDPMRLWAGFKGTIKQTELELALGISREDAIAGADVGTAIDAGDWGAVEYHNMCDVENLRAIYRRMKA
jgi:uncharacterized protein YprB with RNaseH-like and TPR domain